MSAAIITDDELVADLRSRGLVGPISADFLAEYRRDREIIELARHLEATPDGLGRFQRALVRIGIVPPAKENDAPLIAAWADIRAALLAIEATGPDATEEQDAPAWAAFDDADARLMAAEATTVDGAAAKLGRAIMFATTARWVQQAVAADDLETIAGKVEELAGGDRLLVEAFCALRLVTVSAAAPRPLRSALVERNAIMEAMNLSTEDGDFEHEGSEIGRLERLIQHTPAETADDAIVKLITVTQVAAEGYEPDEAMVLDAIRAAQRHLGLGYIYEPMGAAA